MKMKIIILVTLIALHASCIPEGVKDKMDEGMAEAQKILGDQEFKKAIAHIEMHKLRNGKYPKSLSDLKFLTAMDSSIFNFTEYTKLDSGYELNLKMEFPSFRENKTQTVYLHYPPEFWNGLGCVKSNVK